MNRCSNESQFQHELMMLLSVDGHVQDHRLSNHSHVPDMSAAIFGWDFWLELKFGRFKFGHDKYDECEFRETTRGQLDWLARRAEMGDSICGILGYIAAEQLDFAVFIPAKDYLDLIWRPIKKLDVGAAVLRYGRGVGEIKTAEDMVELLTGGPVRGGRPTRVRG